MSVNDESTLPWLQPEKLFVREAVEKGLPVLGVCFGAQLIASALGARVYRNTQRKSDGFRSRRLQPFHTCFDFLKNARFSIGTAKPSIFPPAQHVLRKAQHAKTRHFK